MRTCCTVGAVEYAGRREQCIEGSAGGSVGSLAAQCGCKHKREAKSAHTHGQLTQKCSSVSSVTLYVFIYHTNHVFVCSLFEDAPHEMASALSAS
jgi:hypothetical protein